MVSSVDNNRNDLIGVVGFMPNIGTIRNSINADTLINTNVNNWTTISSPPQNIIFKCGNKEMIRLEENGDILVREKLITNDMEVITLFKEYLRLNNNSITKGYI